MEFVSSQKRLKPFLLFWLLFHEDAVTEHHLGYRKQPSLDNFSTTLILEVAALRTVGNTFMLLTGYSILAFCYSGKKN